MSSSKLNLEELLSFSLDKYKSRMLKSLDLNSDNYDDLENILNELQYTIIPKHQYKDLIKYSNMSIEEMEQEAQKKLKYKEDIMKIEYEHQLSVNRLSHEIEKSKIEYEKINEDKINIENENFNKILKNMEQRSNQNNQK